MPTFRIYNVVDKTTGKIVKIGSTVKTLKARWWHDSYKNPQYKNCELTLRREFDWPENDKEFGLLLLRVREQFDISNAHLWSNEDGWNIQEPIKFLLNGFGDVKTDKLALKLAGCSLGGKISSSLPKQKEKIAALGRKNGGRYFIENPPSFEYQSKGGKRNAELGIIQSAAKKFREEHPEHQIKAGKASGKKSVEQGLGCHTPENRRKGGLIQGPINGRKNVESGHMHDLGTNPKYSAAKSRGAKKSAQNQIANKTGIFAPGFLSQEHQQNAAWANAHKRYHTPQGKINPECPRCAQQKVS